MTIILILAFSGLLVVILTLPVYLREHRLLKLSKAKLEISRTITAMEELMCSGKLTMGEACHDKVFKTMHSVQLDGRFFVPWKIWKILPTDEDRKFREKLHEEIEAKGSELGELLGRFSTQYFRAYNYRNPFLSKLFCLWVVCFAIGIVAAVIALHKLKNLNQGYRSMQKAIAEWHLALAMSARDSTEKSDDFLNLPNMV